MSTIYTVEVRELTGWAIQDWFYSYEVAEGYAEECVTDAEWRISCYKLDNSDARPVGEKVDYTDTMRPAERLKKPEYHLTTPYDEEWSSMSQNPYAYAPGNGIVNE